MNSRRLSLPRLHDARWLWLIALLVAGNLALLPLHRLWNSADPQALPVVPELDESLPSLRLLRPHSPATGDGECFSIGPLQSLLAQQRAEDRLRVSAERVHGRQTRSDRDRGWWVFLAAGTRSEAMALTRHLAELGIEDFFVVTGGDMENVVSVGLYENIDNARARQRQMLALGFKAEMEVRRETVPQFWVDYRSEPGMASAWRFILEASPGAQHRSIPCWEDTRSPPQDSH